MRIHTWTLVLCGLCLWLGLTIGIAEGKAKIPKFPLYGFSPVEERALPEEQHSLIPPLDNTQVYWNFGGSTVLTDKFIRLTPATIDRSGWVWNEYPIEAEGWQVEVDFKIHSRPHFGGDGMAIWMIHGDFDPAFQSEPDSLSGALFGMRDDFQGFGVILDVYDNDNRRDNPSIFVLANDDPEKTPKWDHHRDFKDNMLKAPYVRSSGSPSDTSCVAQIRNTNGPAKLLLSFKDQVLHVFVQAGGAQPRYRLCLQVMMPRKSYKDYHLAFTGITGQVTDQHDILRVTTRYLDNIRKSKSWTDFDDWGEDSWLSTIASVLSMVVMFGGFAAVAGSAYELHTLQEAAKSHVDPVQIADSLNTWLRPTWLAQVAVCGCLFLTGRWIPFLLNLPLAVWRIYRLSRGAWAYYPQDVLEFMGRRKAGAPHEARGLGKLSPRHRLLLVVVFLGLLQLYYIYNFFAL